MIYSYRKVWDSLHQESLKDVQEPRQHRVDLKQGDTAWYPGGGNDIKGPAVVVYTLFEKGKIGVRIDQRLEGLRDEKS